MISELKLLKGSPIYVDNIPIYPLTIGEVTELDDSEYFKYLSAVTIDKSRVETIEDISNFELVCSFCVHDFPFSKDINGVEESFKNVFLKGLAVFLHDKVEFIFNDQYVFFLVGEFKGEESKIITQNNFDKIIEVIKYQNCMIKTKSEEEHDNPANERAKEILEKRKRARELLAKAKKGEEGEPLTLADLVSILVANGNGITPFNVWDMNFYMFNNQFNRMRMLEDYDINIRSLLAGAKSEDIKLKHWMGKID